MQRILLGMLTALGVLAAPHLVPAEEAKGPPRGRAELMFKWLDTNKDGQVALDETVQRPPGPGRQSIQGSGIQGGQIGRRHLQALTLTIPVQDLF